MWERHDQYIEGAQTGRGPVQKALFFVGLIPPLAVATAQRLSSSDAWHTAKGLYLAFPETAWLMMTILALILFLLTYLLNRTATDRPGLSYLFRGFSVGTIIIFAVYFVLPLVRSLAQLTSA